MKEDNIYKEYCKLNNISWQDASLYKVDIKNTFQYRCFALKKEIYGIYEVVE
jgi:hypothetical protein